MTELDNVRAAAHQANIGRYRRLLTTELTDLEREFILRRLAEEIRALDELQSNRRAGRSIDARPFRSQPRASPTVSAAASSRA